MSDTGSLVFRDGEGDYFLVPREALEQGRVRDEDKAEVERLLAESDDVHGHSPFFLGMLIGTALGSGAAIATVAANLPTGTLKGLSVGADGKPKQQ